MRRRIVIIVCLLCSLLVGCSNKSSSTAYEEDMTEVIVIKNELTETDLESYAFTMAADEAGITNAYSFVEDADYDIKSLIRTYYDYIASGDYSLATLLTNDSSRLDKEVFLEKSQYIDSVKSLTCYSMESIQDGNYIVIAKCGVLTLSCPDIITIVEAFYVCTNESGTRYICGSAVGDEVKSYNSIMLSDTFVTEMIEEVAAANENVLEKYEGAASLNGIVIPEEGMFRYLYELPVVEE